MLAELFVAALAFYLWLALEPGLARGLAYDVAVLASVTTLFFNANPLLRYDGYFILTDLIEIPNLGSRANKYWQYLAERWLFGVRGAERPSATPGERRWFIGYAPLAYVYRLFVSLTIAWIVAQRFFVAGVVIALWAVVMRSWAGGQDLALATRRASPPRPAHCGGAPMARWSARWRCSACRSDQRCEACYGGRTRHPAADRGFRARGFHRRVPPVTERRA